MISFHEIEKSYESGPVLGPVSHSFEEGKTHAIVGASGSGKSTMLRLILGLISPHRGRIEVDGESVCAATLTRIRQKIGYVVQEGGLFPHLTAGENVALLGLREKWKKEDIQKRTEELCLLTKIPKELLERYPNQLSGGQRQRFGLMRALFLDPTYLLLDEPLGSLDPLIRFELQEELKRIFNSLHKTVLLVTHDLSEAAFFGHTITLLRAGKVEQSGSFENLWHEPATDFVRRFFEAQRPLGLFSGDPS